MMTISEKLHKVIHSVTPECWVSVCCVICLVSDSENKNSVLLYDFLKSM